MRHLGLILIAAMGGLTLSPPAVADAGEAPPADGSAEAATPEVTLLPVSERAALPELPPLTGPNPRDRLTASDLQGKVAVINIWYEW